MQGKFFPISDYGLIGSTRTAALVNRLGGIDWWCAPNFDSDPVLFPLLDPRKGGICSFAMRGLRAVSRRYIPETALLETTLAATGGTFTVTDFMPIIRSGFSGPVTGAAQIARVIHCTKGKIDVRLRIEPAFGFDHALKHKLTLVSEGGIFSRDDEEFTAYAEDAKAIRSGAALVLTRTLREGESMPVMLTYATPRELTRSGLEDVVWLAETSIGFWRRWVQKIQFDGPYREQVVRSAITLKLCSFSATGAIVAAPTTSLPERMGGPYNWDYRFTWLRDATFTLVALLSLECVDEAFQFFKFLHATLEKQKEFRTLFTIFGERPSGERDLRSVEGYRGSKPVRVGNAASEQLQLDIYGELLHCISLLLSHEKLDKRRFSFERDLWPMIEAALKDVVNLWKKPDCGIWETRDRAQRFTYSQGMCWVALDRGIRIAERFEKKVPREWKTARDAVKQEFEQHAFSGDRGSLVQAYGSEALDAAVLRLTLMGVLPPDDKRVAATLRAIGADLCEDGFILRNRNLDAAKEGEGAFLPCSFWYAENLALTGYVDRARQFFERLLSHANDLGLFSEEYDTELEEQVGNFPQAFTHVALINCAVQLAIASRGHYSESHQIVKGVVPEDDNIYAD